MSHARIDALGQATWPSLSFGLYQQRWLSTPSPSAVAVTVPVAGIPPTPDDRRRDDWAIAIRWVTLIDLPSKYRRSHVPKKRECLCIFVSLGGLVSRRRGLKTAFFAPGFTEVEVAP